MSTAGATMTVADVLRAARKKIEQGWCQHVYAKDDKGLSVDLLSADTACQWCASGAIHLVGDGNAIAKGHAFRILKQTVGSIRSVPRWNDDPHRTQAEVLAAFDKAIELAESA